MEMSLNQRDYSIWDEHTNYFTLDTLKLFLRLCGCSLIHYDRHNFSGTCIYVVGKASNDYSISFNYLDASLRKIEKYSSEWPLFKEKAFNYFQELKRDNNKIAVYGLSARIFSILDYLGVPRNYIDLFIDDNQDKIDALAFQSTTSDQLYQNDIDVCILGVSGENEDLVVQKHKKFIDNGGKFISLLPPSNLLPDFWFK